jgi:hypothetical protein
MLLGVGKHAHENQSHQDQSGYEVLRHGCHSGLTLKQCDGAIVVIDAGATLGPTGRKMISEKSRGQGEHNRRPDGSANLCRAAQKI